MTGIMRHFGAWEETQKRDETGQLHASSVTADFTLSLR